MRFTRKNFGIVAAALLASAWSLPAAASVTFDFSFVAPLTNGDTASGSGKVTTADADPDGHYLVLDASGSYIAYQSEQNVRTIAGAGGIYDFATSSVEDAFLYRDALGNLVTNGIFFYEDPYGGIGLKPSAGGGYGGFFTEVGVSNGTLSFAQAAAAVPEPGTWALMLIGLGAAGVSLRRRKTPRLAYA